MSEHGWRKLREPGIVVALSALLVALTALVVSIVEVRIMREDQHASVWPRVSVGVNLESSDSTFAIQISNNGIGPALIHSINVAVDGGDRTDWRSFEQAFGLDRPAMIQSREERGVDVLPAGHTTHLYEVTGSGAYEALVAGLSRIRATTCFCSVYGRCWSDTIAWGGTAAGTSGPTEVVSCEK